MKRFYAHLPVLLGLACPVARAAESSPKSSSKSSHAPTFWDSVVEYVRDYRLGVSYGSVNGSVDLAYETDGIDAKPGCSPRDATSSRCKAQMPFDQGSGLKLLVDQPVESQGLFYFDFGPNFAFEQFSSSYGAQATNDPLSEATFKMVGFNTTLNVWVGLTPQGFWPDLIFSIGAGAGPLFGRATINGETQSRTLVNLYVIDEIDLVLWRARSGQLSLFASGESGGNFYFQHSYGAVQNPYYQFSRYDSGLSYLIKSF